MAAEKYLPTVVKSYGPNGRRKMICKFSVAGAALTALEQFGCTVARTGVGTYVITCGRTYKALTVKLTIQRAAGAVTQEVWLTASDTNTVTFTQFTSGSTTAVDTLAFTAHVEIDGRSNS